MTAEDKLLLLVSKIEEVANDSIRIAKILEKHMLIIERMQAKLNKLQAEHDKIKHLFLNDN